MAANKILEIVIKAKDEATETLKGLSKTLKANEKDLKSVAIGAGVAFAGIAAFAGNAVKAASEAQAVQAQLGAVIKSTGGIAGVTADQAIKLSQSLQKVTSFGDEAILSAENMLLTFTNIGGKVFPEATQTVLDMSVALGQDLKSSSIQLGKALNDPIDGISALSRVGVKFTDVQKEMIEKLVESGDIMGAQKVILKELATEFGGSAAAEANTFGGQIKQINELVGDFNESIGNALIPVLKNITVNIKPIIESMIKWVELHPKLTAGIIIAVAAVTGLTAVVATLGLAILAFQAIAWPVVGLVLAIAVAIGALIAVGYLLYKNWDEISAFASSVWGSIKDMFFNTLEAIGAFFVATWDNIKSTLETVGYFIIGLTAMILDFMLPGWEEKLTLLYNIWLTIWGGIKLALSETFAFIQVSFDVLVKYFDVAWKAIIAGFDWAKTKIKEAMDWISSALDPIFDKIEKLMKKLSDLGAGVKNALGSVVSKGKEVLSGKATGGGVQIGQSYMVGERGPEMFTPASNGSITPNHQLAGAGGGMNLTINMNGGTYLDPHVAEDIGDMIIQKFKQIARF